MPTDLSDYATVQETAQMLQITEQGVRRALKEKRLKGQKMGKIWLIPKNQFKQPNENGRHPN